MENSKKRLCSQRKPLPQHFDSNVSSKRMGYIVSTNKKWINGTQLRFMFIDGDESQWRVVRHAFDMWKQLAIGLSFKEVTNIEESIVRIGFDFTDGSWSYVGRDVLTISKTQRTMNFGWDLTADAYGLTTALHEIGHTLGFNHEHQNDKAGIVWNAPAVYAEFSGPPNHWTNAQIDSNILTKMPANTVQGSNWDPDSIMEYEFGPGLVVTPIAYENGIFPPGTLSPNDVTGVRRFYPPLAPAIPYVKWNTASPIKAGPGEQDDFVFVAPATKKFTFQTTGLLDAVMTISEKTKEKDHYMAGDDDSGTDRNAKVSLPLVEGREYVVSVRVMFAEDAQSGSLIVS
jgi:hypothetical protein